MSRQDPGAAACRQQYQALEMRPCTCGHPVGVHAVNSRGLRAACSAYGAKAKACGCKLFVAAAVGRG